MFENGWLGDIVWVAAFVAKDLEGKKTPQLGEASIGFSEEGKYGLVLKDRFAPDHEEMTRDVSVASKATTLLVQ